MKKQKQMVPPAPKEEIAVTQEDLSRLAEWISFFKKLSPRISLLRSSDPKFKALLVEAEADLREVKTIEPDYTLVGWPEESEVAFAITVDSSVMGSPMPEYEPGEVYFFCFDDSAFTPQHFCWDGDAEADHSANTFSLRNYGKDLLSWKFVTSLIVRKVRQLENRVPKLRE